MAYQKMKPPVGVVTGTANGRIYSVDWQGFAQVADADVSAMTGKGWSVVVDQAPGVPDPVVTAKVDPVTGGSIIPAAGGADMVPIGIAKSRSAAALAAAPTTADQGLSIETVFYDSSDPTKRYTMNVGKTAFVAIGGGESASLYTIFRELRDAAAGKNPIETAGQTLSYVSSVLLDQAAFAAPKTYNYFDADGPNRIRIRGVPKNDKTLLVTNSSGFVRVPSYSSPSGVTTEALRGCYAEAKVECTSFQWNINGLGASSQFFSLYVDGVQVSPSPNAAVSNNIQITFASRGVHTVGISFEQSLFVSGITVSEDDTVFAIDPLPAIVVYGDSYVNGTTSPAVNGAPVMVSAMSMLSGANCIPLGVSGTGYINDGGVSFPMTHTERLTKLVATINAAGAPLVVIPAGYNDVSQAATAANIQAAATTILNAILSGTTAKIVVTGAMPGKRNNSAAQKAVDLGIANAVAADTTGRVAFVQVAGAASPWITGTRDTAHTTGLIAGNSRYYIGADGTHPSSLGNGDGYRYHAEKLVQSIIETCRVKGW